jgi:hypothetical protein
MIAQSETSGCPLTHCCRARADADEMPSPAAGFFKGARGRTYDPLVLAQSLRHTGSTSSGSSRCKPLPKAGNAGGVLYPGYRVLASHCADSTATAIEGLQITPRLAEMSGKNYAEFAVQYVDRDNSQIISIVSFN